MISILLVISSLMPKSTYNFPDNITKEEKKYITTISKVINKKPLEISKTSNNFIYITYDDTKYLVSPSQTIEIVWVSSNNSWECLGKEVD